MRASLLCALCALGAAVPAPIKDTVLTITPSADRARVVDLQLGGPEPAVEVRSSLRRAIMASDTFCFRKHERRCRVQKSALSSF